MDLIIQFFKNSVEVQNLGLNLITLSALITIILSTYQMWGISQQILTIRRRQSAAEIFVPLFIFGFFYLASTLIYGLQTGKLAIVYNGLNAGFFLITLLTIWRYQKIKRSDWWSLALFALMIPLMILAPDKKIAYMSCASLMILGAGAQLAWLLIRKKRGSLEPRLFRVYIVTNSAWLIYGLLTADWVLKLSNSISVTIMILITILLRKYKDN